MKRILTCLLAFAMLMGLAAQAEILGEMTVVNCDEWVSLRESADQDAARLKEVPLGAVVTNCQTADNGFIYGEYDGASGYILSQYLKGMDIWEEKFGFKLTGVRSYLGDGERLHLTCTDADGSLLWEMDVESPHATELDTTAAFIAGTQEEPLLMGYGYGDGLTAYDLRTAEPRWMITTDALDLGGGLSHAVAEDGTMYVGGYYGPDPVAIAKNGDILWQAAAPDTNVFWLYKIELTEEGVVGSYDSVDAQMNRGQVCYDDNGELLWRKAN